MQARPPTEYPHCTNGETKAYSVPGICAVTQYVKGQARRSFLGPMWGTEIPGGGHPQATLTPTQQQGASRSSLKGGQCQNTGPTLNHLSWPCCSEWGLRT